MDKKHPRQPPNDKMFIKKEFAKSIHSTAIDKFHITRQSAPDFSFHFVLFQINTYETTELFKVIMLKRVLISSNVDDKLQFCSCDCQFWVIRTVHSRSITLKVSFVHISRVKFFHRHRDTFLWICLEMIPF